MTNLAPLIANSDKIAFASLLATDKIVGVYNSSFNASKDTTGITYTFGGSPYTVYYYVIPHSFGVPVFCDLEWSTDNTTFITGVSGSAGAIAFSDSSNIYIQTPTNSNVSVYYRLVCSWIDNYDSTQRFITPVLPSSNLEIFDTRFNYQKRYIQDVVTLPSGAAGSVSSTVEHNLGYAPNAKMFIEGLPGQVWPANAGGTHNPFFVSDSQNTGYLLIGNNNIIIQGEFNRTAARVWYRIYLDQ